MTLTSNFRFNDQGGADAWRTLDTILALIENHIHDGSNVSTSGPLDQPVLTAFDVDGFFVGGQTIYYVVTLIDASGRESAPSPVAFVTLPDLIEDPDAPSLIYTPTGGFLQAGTYLYALAAYSGDDTYQETLTSPEVQIVIPSGTNTNAVTIDFPDLPEGASGWNIYRLKPNGLTMAFLNSVNMEVATPPSEWVDTGVMVDDCNRRPSFENGTMQNCSILIEYPEVEVPEGFTWKIYRSNVPGEWNNSLVHHVVESSDDDIDDITTEFLDDGDSALPSSPPPLGTATVTNPQKIHVDNHTVGDFPLDRTTGVLPFDQIGEIDPSLVITDDTVLPNWPDLEGATLADVLTNLSTALAQLKQDPNEEVLVTAEYTIEESDVGKIIRVDSPTPVSILIPNPFLDAGFWFEVVQEGAGAVTIAQEGGGGTFHSLGAFTSTVGQYAKIRVELGAVNVFYLYGDLG